MLGFIESKHGQPSVCLLLQTKAAPVSVCGSYLWSVKLGEVVPSRQVMTLTVHMTHSLNLMTPSTLPILFPAVCIQIFFAINIHSFTINLTVVIIGISRGFYTGKYPRLCVVQDSKVARI